jgi:hypothetical protein
VARAPAPELPVVLAKNVGPLHTFALAGAASIVFGLAFARALRRLRAMSEAAPLAAVP